MSTGRCLLDSFQKGMPAAPLPPLAYGPNFPHAATLGPGRSGSNLRNAAQRLLHLIGFLQHVSTSLGITLSEALSGELGKPGLWETAEEARAASCHLRLPQ